MSPFRRFFCPGHFASAEKTVGSAGLRGKRTLHPTIRAHLQPVPPPLPFPPPLRSPSRFPTPWQNKKLVWTYEGFGVVAMPESRCELLVETCGVVVLLLFNRAPRWTYRELRECSGLPLADLDNILSSLCSDRHKVGDGLAAAMRSSPTDPPFFRFCLSTATPPRSGRRRLFTSMLCFRSTLTFSLLPAHRAVCVCTPCTSSPRASSRQSEWCKTIVLRFVLCVGPPSHLSLSLMARGTLSELLEHRRHAMEAAIVRIAKNEGPLSMDRLVAEVCGVGVGWGRGRGMTENLSRTTHMSVHSGPCLLSAAPRRLDALGALIVRGDWL